MDTKQPSDLPKTPNLVMKNLNMETTPVPSGFTTEFRQIFEERIRPSLHNLFQKRVMN